YNSIFSNSCGQNFTNDNFHEYKPVKVFPNPFNNNLNIEGENIELVTVFDLYGREIYSSSKIFKIDNIEWKNGIYIVNIKLESSLKSFKLIKY
ncbi:MAG: T9SS type A sorting domain-containing protein, partial [Flavobacteriales bacterium]|nr:T9SS type A sorting domain-containing protein [Flavobacteriales bacterium]